jgi:hypothetical protein
MIVFRFAIMELKQRKFFSSQTLRFDDTTLYISTWSVVTGTKQWSLKLDEISHSHTVRQLGLFANGCLFAIFIVILCTMVIIQMPFVTILVILAIAMTPLFLGRLMHNYNFIQIETRKEPVLIGYSKREKVEADHFVTGLTGAAKKYLRWKYGTPDADLNRDKQIENFWWLRNHAVITDEEFQQLKSKLTGNVPTK